MAEPARPGRVRRTATLIVIAVASFVAVIVAVEVATDLWLSR